MVMYSRLLDNLRGLVDSESKRFMPADKALEHLRELTGQDFGLDAERWREYLLAHRHDLGIQAFDLA